MFGVWGGPRPPGAGRRRPEVVSHLWALSRGTMNEPAKDYCVIIPGYREEGRIGPVVNSVRTFVPTVVVVDDGSDDDTAGEARAAGAVVLVHEVNKGKGAALDSGFRWARERGVECIITMDADGQHAPEDLAVFIAEYRKNEFPVLIGNRMSNPVGMPLVRRWTNRTMSWLLSRKMGQFVPDTQCGYRLYRCDVLDGISCGSCRFDAESEMLMAVAGRGVPIGSVPIRVIYGDEKSKISPVRDTVRFFRMLRKFKKGNRQ